MRFRGRGAKTQALAVILSFVLTGPVFGSELSVQIGGEGSRSLRQLALAAASAIGNPPTLYWGVGISLFAVLIAVSVMPMFVPVDSLKGERSRLLRVLLDRRLYGLLVGLTVLSLRWPMFAPTLLNSDESHSIACAMKLWVDPVFWRGIDGTTGGPLLYYPLLIPRLIGVPLEYGSARAVGLLALIGAVLLLYGVVRRLFDEGIARVAVLPWVTLMALTTSNHFAHYSSEQIPVFLMVLALYLLIRWWSGSRETDRSLILCGLVLGAIPFAKLQAVPIGLFLALCGVGIIVRRPRRADGRTRTRLVAFIASGLAVPLFFLLMVVSTGVWRDFWQSYVLNNLGYGGRYVQFGDVGLPLARRFWAVIDRSFWTFDLAELVGTTLVFGLLVFIVALILDRPLLMERIGLALLVGVSVVIAVLAVAFPNTLFSHYFLFLTAPVTLFGAVWLALAVEVLRHRLADRKQAQAMAILLALFVALTVVRPFDRRLNRAHPVFSRLAAIQEVDSSPLAEVVLGFGREGEAMAVWGWQPWRYGQTGLYPATRDTQTQWQILDTPQRPYYQDRFASDLQESLPPVFVDTVGFEENSQSPWRPAFWDRESQAHDSFAEIAAVVDRSYRQIGDVEASRIYVARPRLAELERLTGRDLQDLDTRELLELTPQLARVDLDDAP